MGHRDVTVQDRYTTNKPVSWDRFFSGQLDRFGVTELRTPDASPTQRALTDGIAVLWIQRQEDGTAIALSDDCNDVSRILSAIEDCFAVTWGLDDF